MYSNSTLYWQSWHHKHFPIGLAISAVSSYESGSRYPSYEVLVQLARMFHVTTDYLLGTTSKRSIDVTGLDDGEFELISQLVDKLKNK